MAGHQSNGQMGRAKSRRAGADYAVRVLIFFTVLLGFGNLAPTSMAQAVNAAGLTTNSPFVIYLLHPPWIKEMCFVQSQYWEASPDLQGPVTKKGWMQDTNRVGIQPSGMFCEKLSGTPFEPRLPFERQVRGSFDHYDWTTDINHDGNATMCLSSKVAAEGASTNNHSARILQNYETVLAWVRGFGLPLLKSNTFELVAPDKFKALTAEGYLLEGKILTAANDQPLTLTYTFGDNEADVFAIVYKYRADSELPTYFERQEFRNGVAFGLSFTNRIEYAEYGIDTAITNGYKPSMFFTNLAIFTKILIESNGQRFAVGKSDKRILIDDKSPFNPFPDKGVTTSGKSIFILLLIFLVASGFFIRKVQASRSESGEPKNKAK